MEEMGGSEASRYRVPRAVEKKQLVVHRSRPCQNALSFLRVAASGTKRSQPYVRIGRMAPKTNFLLHQEERPLPAALSCQIEVKEALASASRLRKCTKE